MIPASWTEGGNYDCTVFKRFISLYYLDAAVTDVDCALTRNASNTENGVAAGTKTLQLSAAEARGGGAEKGSPTKEIEVKWYKERKNGTTKRVYCCKPSSR